MALCHTAQRLSQQQHAVDNVLHMSKHLSFTITCPAEKHALKFTINWVDQILVRAIQLIVSHDSIAVSAEKDKAFYRDKLENKLNINLEVHMSSPRTNSHIHKSAKPLSW